MLISVYSVMDNWIYDEAKHWLPVKGEGFGLSVLSGIRQICTNIILSSRRVGILKGELRNIHRKRSLYRSVTLSSRQRADIEAYFKHHLGRKYSTKWHRLYQSYTGTHQIDYFPEILFSTRVEPKTNPFEISRVFGDKNLLEMITSSIKDDVYSPQTIFARVRGTYVSQGCIIGFDRAAELLSDSPDAVAKKSIDTSSGRDIIFLDSVNALNRVDPARLRELDDNLGEDYVVQEQILQAETLSKLYPGSINTFRVVTYIARDSVRVSPIALRLGRGGARVDNVHFGGISVGVSPDGRLGRFAFSEMGERFVTHPDTGMIFADYQVEGFDSVVRAAKRLHGALPWLKVLSWDLTLDREGMPVLVEVNTTGQAVWLPQLLTGESMFGEDTPLFLKMAA